MVEMSRSTTSGGTLAPRRVPEAYLRAEVCAFPLTSDFDSALIELDPNLPEHDPTFELWRHCEEHLAEHASGWSLDRMVAVRDRIWFSCVRRRLHGRGLVPVPMHTYLRNLARAHLEAEYHTAELYQADLHEEASGESVDVLSHYHWLTLAIPEDLLLSALPIEPPPSRVSLGPSLVEPKLHDRGVADIHQHGGAAFDYPTLWLGALADLASPEISASVMESPGAPFEGGRCLATWLLAAGIARVVLTEFLIWRESTCFASGVRRSLKEFLYDRRRTQDRLLREWHTLLRTLDGLCNPRGGLPAFAPLQYLYCEFHPEGCRIASKPPRSLEDVWDRCDPVAVRLGLRSTYPGVGERWLMSRALEYLEDVESHETAASVRDEWFARVFWQLVRIRCAHYRYVVQRPLTAGLQWFIRFSDRIGRLGRAIGAVRAESAFRLAGGGGRVQAIELRATVDEHAAGLGRRLYDMLISWERVIEEHANENIEFGVIVLFAKQRDPDQRWAQGRPRPLGEGSFGQPRSMKPRFSEYLGGEALKAIATADLLTAVPLALWLVRGVDVASDELAIPTWVLVPLYAYVRQEAAYAALLPQSRGAPLLRATAHVGEDFRHLMEGLRRMFECTQYLLGSAGGRLGHGTALGVDPRLWAESVGSVLMPTEDRLWDLVFEWRLYSGYRTPADFVASAPAGRLEKVTNQIQELTYRMFKDRFQPDEVAELRHRLHRFMLPPTGTPMQRGDVGGRAVQRGLERAKLAHPKWPPRVLRLLQSYLTDADVFRNGQEIFEVSIDSTEVAALAAVQSALRRAIARRSIVIEVNPTSNLLIGDMLDLRNHPILRLLPIEPDPANPPVPMAIGSDDPIIFSTSLVREYELMRQAGYAAGYSALAVADWLERVRGLSMDCRFCVPWRPDPSTMIRDLEEGLGKYLHLSDRYGRERTLRRRI